MNEVANVADAAKEFGFDYVKSVKCGTIKSINEVRKMCAADTCRAYGKNWSCPPACGSLEECYRKIRECSHGILVQTVGKLEDSLDVETMMETEQLHKKHFRSMYEKMKESYQGLLALGTGCCTICVVCTYPDAPCRFPEKRISSLEAYGILVSDLCKKNDLCYYYGPGTISYTSCFLWK